MFALIQGLILSVFVMVAISNDDIFKQNARNSLKISRLLEVKMNPLDSLEGKRKELSRSNCMCILLSLWNSQPQLSLEHLHSNPEKKTL